MLIFLTLSRGYRLAWSTGLVGRWFGLVKGGCGFDSRTFGRDAMCEMAVYERGSRFPTEERQKRSVLRKT